MSTVLTREAIFAVDDRQIERVEVPEWGGHLYVRGLSGTDRDAFEIAMIEQKRGPKGRTSQEVNLTNLRAKLIVRTAVDSENVATAQSLFTLMDIGPLGEKSGAALQRVYAVAQRLSGLSVEDVEELTDELGKDQNGASGTDSPSPLDIPQSLLPSDTSAATSSANGSPTTGSNPSETDA